MLILSEDFTNISSLSPSNSIYIYIYIDIYYVFLYTRIKYAQYQ